MTTKPTTSDLIAYRRYLTGNDECIKAYKFINAASKLFPDDKLKADAKGAFTNVAHIYDPSVYQKYYRELLPETPLPEEVIFDDWKYPERVRWLKTKLKEQGAKTVLDVGCADGSISLNLAKAGYDVTGLNLFKPSIDVAQERAAKFDLTASFVCGNAFDYETAKKFDAIMLFEIIEHVPDVKEFVDRYSKLLNENGIIYISTPNGCFDFYHSILNPDGLGIRGHVRACTEDSLRKELTNYSFEETHVYGGILSLAIKPK